MFSNRRRRQISTSLGSQPCAAVSSSRPRVEPEAGVQRLICPCEAPLSPSLCPLCPVLAQGHPQGHTHPLVHSRLSCCVTLGKRAPSLSLRPLLQPAGIRHPCRLHPEGEGRPETKNPHGQSSPKFSVPSEGGLSTRCLSAAGRDGAGLRPGATQDLPRGLRLPQERRAAGLPLQKDPGEWLWGPRDVTREAHRGVEPGGLLQEPCSLGTGGTRKNHERCPDKQRVTLLV